MGVGKARGKGDFVSGFMMPITVPVVLTRLWHHLVDGHSQRDAHDVAFICDQNLTRTQGGEGEESGHTHEPRRAGGGHHDDVSQGTQIAPHRTVSAAVDVTLCYSTSMNIVQVHTTTQGVSYSFQVEMQHSVTVNLNSSYLFDASSASLPACGPHSIPFTALYVPEERKR